MRTPGRAALFPAAISVLALGWAVAGNDDARLAALFALLLLAVAAWSFRGAWGSPPFWVAALAVLLALEAIAAALGARMGVSPWRAALASNAIMVGGLCLFAPPARQLAWKGPVEIPKGDRLLLVAGAILLASALVLVAVEAVSPPPPERFTEMFLLTPDGRADFPESEVANASLNVTLHVVPHEGEVATFTLNATLQDGAMEGAGFAPNATRPLATWNLTLADGQDWNETLHLSTPAAGARLLHVELVRLGDAKPYREVDLLLRVTTGAG